MANAFYIPELESTSTAPVSWISKKKKNRRAAKKMDEFQDVVCDVIFRSIPQNPVSSRAVQCFRNKQVDEEV